MHDRIVSPQPQNGLLETNPPWPAGVHFSKLLNNFRSLKLFFLIHFNDPWEFCAKLANILLDLVQLLNLFPFEIIAFLLMNFVH